MSNKPVIKVILAGGHIDANRCLIDKHNRRIGSRLGKKLIHELLQHNNISMDGNIIMETKRAALFREKRRLRALINPAALTQAQFTHHGTVTGRIKPNYTLPQQQLPSTYGTSPASVIIDDPLMKVIKP